MSLWEKIKDYVGIGLIKAEEAGKALKKAGRESDTDLHSVASKVARGPKKKKKK